MDSTGGGFLELVFHGLFGSSQSHAKTLGCCNQGSRDAKKLKPCPSFFRLFSPAVSSLRHEAGADREEEEEEDRALVGPGLPH